MAAIAAAFVHAWWRFDPIARTKTRYAASALAARVIAIALAVHDPYADVVDSPICNCSSDIPYRCADPTGSYNDRVLRDPRLASLVQLPPHRIENYAAIMNLLRDQFAHGGAAAWRDREGTGYHVLERLDAAARGERFQCRVISTMLAQLVGSTGGYARIVALLSRAGEGHVVTELWVEDAGPNGKWVMFDPDYNVWFSAPDGTPLSALDLHRMEQERRFDAAVAHRGRSANTQYTPALHSWLLGVYANLSFGAQANWLSTELPAWHPRRHPTAREYLWSDGETVLPRIYYRDVIEDEARIYFTPCRPWLASGESPH